MPTRWAGDVSPTNALVEYPRPQLRRADWANLNGLWDFCVTPLETEPNRFDARILVPFPIESALSGVGRALRPDELLWLRRRFSVPTEWAGRGVRLHFGAVDWEATVWCNDHRLGSHRGGYLPFHFDLPDDALAAGEFEIRVAVSDPTERTGKQVGKQKLRPKGIQYTAVSGIWQTVWVEPLPDAHIDRVRITPHATLDGVTLCAEGTGGGAFRARFVVTDGGREVARGEAAPDQPLSLPVPDGRPWSPEDPHLYDVDVRLLDGEEERDRVATYFGLRWFDVRPDDAGVKRLHLNGEPVFQLGPLDQGYWPDGLYTAPTDEALRFDLEVCKRLGFNVVRKHVKVEPLRWYYHCDRLGLIVWQDMPNGGADITSPAFMACAAAHLGLKRRIRDDRARWRFGRRSENDRRAFRAELAELVEHLRDVTCIGGWVPFNEGWGQFDSVAVAEDVKRLDPTRPVDAASGWFDQGGGDIHTIHRYVGPAMPRPDAERALGLSEFGGIGLKVANHRWKRGFAFTYRMEGSPAELTEQYLTRLARLRDLVQRGLSQAIYTQLTDVENELNGLLTYDREVEKLDFERAAALHAELVALRADRGSR
jgi:beta-galactosidase/beta-glucuronidase